MKRQVNLQRAKTMKHANKRFTETEESMLKRMKGSNLLSIDAVLALLIMLDKEVWFSETIVVKWGKSIEELLYDESVNWEDDPEEDPTTHFEFRTETQHL